MPKKQNKKNSSKKNSNPNKKNLSNKKIVSLHAEPILKTALPKTHHIYKYFIIFFIFASIFLFSKIKDDQNKFEEVKKENITESVATTSKVVALTFDADMTERMKHEYDSKKVKSWYNQDVIRVLTENKIPATLFLSGMWIEMYPHETKTLSENSLFELGNHSYSHESFGGHCYKLGILNRKDYKEDMQKTEDLLSTNTIHHTNLFRFPGLCFNKESIKVAKDLNLEIVNGDVYSGDGFEKNKNNIVNRVLRNVKPGSIVVMHMHGGPNAPKTADALKEIYQELSNQGYTFVKVSDLLKQNSKIF